MNISEELKTRLKFISNCNITEDVYKKLLENTFATLAGKSETHSMSTLYNSKPDLLKQAHAILLQAGAEFARNNMNGDEVKAVLTEINFNQNRTKLFVDLYETNKDDVQVQLGNIGMHPPHIVDADWKIDYIVKASNLDQSEGPIFRISLVSSKYDECDNERKLERINFSCNSQELQDLVYKLKDAVRHCQRLTTE
ncbi:hypothetical protein RN001_010789 [Aquatica leii]|uniref:COMM domain-containing protein 3 n=1 Tax=Aquatica leii TaxID=1421715 RepID=A0AAN7QHR2_9COLE|nr:hypothetical protein RN001_010789 [Aquatica leii]